MGLSYNPSGRKWNLVPEKADHKTNRPLTQTVSITRNVTTLQPSKTPVVIKGQATYPLVSVTERRTATVNVNAQDSDVINALNAAGIPREAANELIQTRNNARQTNEQNQSLNNQSAALNAAAQKKNAAYNSVLSLSNRTKGGDYVQMRDQIRRLNLDNTTKKILEDYYKAFYQTEKLQRWDLALGAKPPYGKFDPAYYRQQNPAVAAAWRNAVANDDIDITQRYGENGYYLQHYTTQGKQSGLRGNAPEEMSSALSYKESKPTDKDLEQVRNRQLGVDTPTQAQRLLNIPEIAAEWKKAKDGDPYWKAQAKEKYLDPDKPEDFAALFRLSDRPEDKQVSLRYNVNAGYGITELEDAINEAVGANVSVDVKRFGALTQDALKTTIDELKKARDKEQMLDLLNGFGGFSEVMDINKELSNSIMGDLGAGGILSFMSGDKAEDSLEKSLQNITGVRNNVTYNWQQWFDTTLKKRYEQDLELGYTAGDAKGKIKIQADFARNFIDEYLTPRFNTSRSMDEFVEYLDVRQEEQNPFQTQDLLNATTQVANLRAKMYLDQVKASSDRSFNSDFYFNPTGDKARISAYAKQAETVSSDWNAAKRGDPYWVQQAYRFGVNLNDENQMNARDAFARMHFQVKGQKLGYDGAEDILNAGKVQDEIYSQILPAVKNEALKQGTVFGLFETPEEFADKLLKGLDPNDKTSWEKVLERYGLTNFKGTVDELKEYVVNILRTGSAQKIREELKYLNEKRKKPTQQNLGVTYIERQEDFKDTQEKGTSEFYKVFQKAGYQGSEDEFYEKFFPDADRDEMTALTKAGTTGKFEMEKLDFSDPFASLGTMTSFFGDDEEQDSDESDTGERSSSFFNLGLDDDDDDEDTNYKSKSGTRILGEFTSMFKGF
jgi:hypothetical protein